MQSNLVYHSSENWLNGCLGVSIWCEIGEIWENWYCGTNEIYIYIHISGCVVLYIHIYIICVYLVIHIHRMTNANTSHLHWKNIYHKKKIKENEKKKCIYFTWYCGKILLEISFAKIQCMWKPPIFSCGSYQHRFIQQYSMNGFLSWILNW